MEKDMIAMSRGQTKRLYVIHQTLDKRIIPEKATELVGFSSRQLRLLLRRVRAEGGDDIILRSCKTSKRCVPMEIKRKHLICLGGNTVISALPVPARSFPMFMKSR